MLLDPNDLLTPSDAARVLGLSADSVRVLSDNGRLPGMRTVGGRRLFRRADVDRLAIERAGHVAHALSARQQPIVLAFEDLHWADPTTLDLLKTLAERGAYFLNLFRP